MRDESQGLKEYVSLSIEYGHFYLGSEIGEEQIRGSELAASLLENQCSLGALTVLVDDRQQKHSSIDKRLAGQIQNRLRVGDRVPEWVVLESKLTAAAEMLFRSIPTRLIAQRQKSNGVVVDLSLNRENIRLLKIERCLNEDKRHFSCAMLSAAWVLCRLGELELPGEACLATGDTPFIAKQALTILPLRFRRVEEKVERILSLTHYRSALSRINYIYFEGTGVVFAN